MIDLFFRATSRAFLLKVLRSSAFESLVGPVVVEDENGLRPAEDVAYTLWRPDTVVITPAEVDEDGTVITPAVTDSNWWLHLRLVGAKAAADDDADDAGLGGKRSRIKRWVADRPNIQIVTVRGVRALRYDGSGPDNGETVWLTSGAELESTGMLFHKFLGLNQY